MTLRDRLEAKARRREGYRVLVDDPSVAASRVSDAHTMLLAAQATPDRAGALDAAQEALAAAQGDLEACYELVDFAALDPDDYDALVTAHTDADGDLDRSAMLPELAAACAVDESVKDADWWRTLLTTGGWSAGERDGLFDHLFVLNYAIPRPGLGKG